MDGMIVWLGDFLKGKGRGVDVLLQKRPPGLDQTRLSQAIAAALNAKLFPYRCVKLQACLRASIPKGENTKVSDCLVFLVASLSAPGMLIRGQYVHCVIGYWRTNMHT